MLQIQRCEKADQQTVLLMDYQIFQQVQCFLVSDTVYFLF